eukprot:TRINITY_DN11319_c0_g1_i1.p1 TRINITY_DN11319_c0_g1~~TRINITY_DN11319_c0_g1_i1.p1  ORF type:complete len:358 (-),score=58.46 TRINITY_DN11319_c0_g1_i1:147-1220(-)
MSQQQIKCLVTGGAGFLGQVLVKQLLSSGKYDVTIFDIRAVEIEGTKSVIADLTNLDQVKQALTGMEIVFHCATASPTSSNAANQSLMYNVNVLGTRNVIDACLHARVPKLVYTSSASVVFDGRDLVEVDEKLPYAQNALDYYTSTKIKGEKLVLEANGKGDGTYGLATVALRPSGIFGEGDPLMVPTMVQNAKKGKMKFMIGDGQNLFDFTYVGNVAQAHIQAADALNMDSPLAGRAYFITNQEPRRFWEFSGDILEGLGYERPYIVLPVWLLYFVAVVLEIIIIPLLKLFGIQKEFSLTTFRVLVVSSIRVFSNEAAKRDFGYVPKVDMNEALKRTLNSMQHLRASDKVEGEHKD